MPTPVTCNQRPCLWASVHFLLVCGLASLALTQSAFAQATITQVAAPPPQLHQLSDAEWQSLLRRTQVALAPSAGNSPTRSAPGREPEPHATETKELQSLVNVPTLQRETAFREAVLGWCQSKDFAKSQSDSWIQHHFPPTAIAPHVAPWNDSLHTEWLQSSIAANESFFKFLQQQLAADLEAEDVRSALPTASWFRGRSWEPISLPTLDATQSTRPSAEWYERITDSQRTQRNDLDRAIASILKTEAQDWQRLLVAKTVEQWQGQHDVPPLPSDSDLIAQWPDAIPVSSTEEAVIGEQGKWTDSMGREIISSPMRIGTGYSASVPVSSPLSLSREWTLVWNLDIESDAATTFDADQTWLLFSQHPDGLGNDNQGLPRGITIAWHSDRVRCSLVHDDPISAIEIESLKAIPLQDRLQLAVVYDGTQAASGLRIACDGQFLETRVLADRIAREFASPSPTRWEMGDANAKGLSNANGVVASIEDFQCYRIALTEPELSALAQAFEWKPWAECSDRERLGWVEYYARRVDLDWRYQRESLLYYLSNRSRLSNTIPFVPVMDGTASMAGWGVNPLRFPGTLLSTEELRLHENGVRWLGAGNRREFAIALLHNESSRAAIAAAEVQRQWLALTQTLSEEPHSGSDQPSQRMPVEPSTLEPSLLRRLTDGFIDSGGDRQQLLLQLVSSPNWLAIALDLKP